MREIDIYTCQLAKWRKVKEKNLTLIDTTIKSGLRWLAPNWDMVIGYKKGNYSKTTYTHMYIRLMNISLSLNEEKWEKLILENDNLVLACYCKAGDFCHRHLLKEFIKRQAEEYGLIVNMKGEIE